jgi:hypothetical protein
MVPRSYDSLGDSSARKENGPSWARTKTKDVEEGAPTLLQPSLTASKACGQVWCCTSFHLCNLFTWGLCDHIKGLVEVLKLSTNVRWLSQVFSSNGDYSSDNYLAEYNCSGIQTLLWAATVLLALLALLCLCPWDTLHGKILRTTSSVMVVYGFWEAHNFVQDVFAALGFGRTFIQYKSVSCH